MYSMAFKCWAVLMSSFLTAYPLCAQVGDTSPIPPGVIAAPVHPDSLHRDGSSLQQLKPALQTPDPEIDSEEVRLNANAESFENKKPFPAETGLQEPDDAAMMKDYLRGIAEGKRDTKGRPYWVLAGLSGTGLCICFSVAGIGLALAVPYYPPPPGEMLVGKSSKYIEGYYEGYTARSRWKNAAWASLGFLAAVAIDLALNYPITFGNIHIDMDQPE
jgi:hypothetical protein